MDIAAAIYAWAESWARPHSELYAFRAYDLEAYILAVRHWLLENHWCVPDAVVITGQLLFCGEWIGTGVPRFAPFDMDSHLFIVSEQRLAWIHIQHTPATGVRVVAGHELFVANTAADLQAFAAGHCVRHCGFFTDGLYGYIGPNGQPIIPPHATEWTRLQYAEFLADVDAQIRALPGTYQAPLQPGWRVYRQLDGSLYYEHEATRRRIQQRPAIGVEIPPPEEPAAPAAKKGRGRRAVAAPASKKLARALRKQVWDTYIGREKGVALCLCCHINEIDRDIYECGHVIAQSQDGPNTVENLRPICGTCNRDMGTRHMAEFMADNGFGPLAQPLRPAPPSRCSEKAKERDDHDSGDSEDSEDSEGSEGDDAEWRPPRTRAAAASTAKKTVNVRVDI